MERYLLSHATRTTPAGLAQGPTALRDTGIHVDLGRVHQAAHITVRLSPPPTAASCGSTVAESGCVSWSRRRPTSRWRCPRRHAEASTVW